MTVLQFKCLLLCCLAINYGILIVWFGVFFLAHDWLFRLHGRWFKLSVERFDALTYAGMAVYKIGVLLFNLVPWIALKLVLT